MLSWALEALGQDSFVWFFREAAVSAAESGKNQVQNYSGEKEL